MALTHNASIIRNGLVLQLDAANVKSYPGTGTTWYDISGNGKNAIKNGSQSPTYPQWNSLGYFTFTGGTTGNAYSYFDVTNIPSFSALSIFAWYKTSNTSDSKTIVRMDNSDFELSVNASANLFYAAGTNWSDINAQPTQANATDGYYHNIGLTFDGTTLLAYFDNAQIASTIRGSSTTTAAGTLRIGTRNDAYWQHFVGDICNVSLYNRVLTASEIAQNYEALRGRYL